VCERSLLCISGDLVNTVTMGHHRKDKQHVSKDEIYYDPTTGQYYQATDNQQGDSLCLSFGRAISPFL
jgi:hypothetical protein